MRRGMIMLAVFCLYQHSHALIIRHDIDPRATIVPAGAFEGVLKIDLQDAEGVVTFEATLIAERWLLTCAHFADAGIVSNQSVRIHGSDYPVDTIVIHPGYAEHETDVALIRLSRPVEHVPVIPLYLNPLQPQMQATLIGTGSFGTGDTGRTIDDGIKRKATNKIESVSAEWLFFRFDAPASQHVTPFEGVCGPGNSGGPALVFENDTYYLAGVSSHSETSGKDEGVYGIFDIYANITEPSMHAWITGTMAALDFFSGSAGHRDVLAFLQLIPHPSPARMSAPENVHLKPAKSQNLMKKLQGCTLQSIVKSGQRIQAMYAADNRDHSFLLEAWVHTDGIVRDIALTRQKIQDDEDMYLPLPTAMVPGVEIWGLPPTYVGLRISDFFEMLQGASDEVVDHFLDESFEVLPGNEEQMHTFFNSLRQSVDDILDVDIIEFKKNRATIKFRSGDVTRTLTISVNKTSPHKINGLSVVR